MADRGASSIARFGFSDAERAESELRSAGWWGDRGLIAGADVIVSTLSRVADPDQALHSMGRLREALGVEWAELAEQLRSDVGLRARLMGVLGSSAAFGDHLVARPKDWMRLRSGDERESVLTRNYDGPLQAIVESSTERTASTAAGADASGVSALRGEYRAILLEIASADLANAVEPNLPVVTYEQVTEALSDAAVAALRSALTLAMDEVGVEDAPVCVIAMGKCGGRELNYVSDVDVVFVAESEDVLPEATRVASTMMRIAGVAFFDVDAALRPEGKAGALVRTLDGHLNYYRKWARTWEFQALLKARPVAGDMEVGQRYVESLWPMVWKASEREDFVTDVRSMRRRVEEHVPSDLAERELKLGRGGLRDVEFAVQLLQLVHGRSDEALRFKTTVEGLRALGEGGYVARTDAAELVESYEFLRGVEHRLQIRNLRRTHLFPALDETDSLRSLARSLGIRSSARKAATDILVQEYRRNGNRVRRLHEKLFYRPLLEAVARVPTSALRLTTDAARERLSALGFSSPEGALRHIGALTAGVSRRASIQGTLLPILLDLFAGTPDPDGGLLAYRKVSEALAETPWYLRVLRDEGVVVERLAFLLGTSKLVPELLVRAPEVLWSLSDVEALAGRDLREVATSLRSAVARHTSVDRAVAAARSLRRHELLRIACADLLGLMPPPAVFQALSNIWVAVLDAALDSSVRDVAARDEWSTGVPARIAVIGMGRLGGFELGYGSDADVLFVCEPLGDFDDATAVRFAGAVVERVRKSLGAPSQDPPLEVDIGLRPEGRRGAPVRTLRSYLNYYERWGEVWEAQALLRAQAVAGDRELGERFCAAIAPIRYPVGGIGQEKAREIRRIKARVDSERLPRGADRTTHTKLGRGGLADVEWTVQLLQLRYGSEYPCLRTTSTLDGIEAASRAGLLDVDDAEVLMEAWILAMRTRNAVMLVRGKPGDEIPKDHRDLAAMSAALGYASGVDSGEVLDDYLRVTRRAHGVVERVFYDS